MVLTSDESKNQNSDASLFNKVKKIYDITNKRYITSLNDPTILRTTRVVDNTIYLADAESPSQKLTEKYKNLQSTYLVDIYEKSF